MDTDSEAISQKGRMLFGAGYVFGVFSTLLIFMIVVSAMSGETTKSIFKQDFYLTMTAGVTIISLIGIALYLFAVSDATLSVPENETLGVELLGQSDSEPLEEREEPKQ